MKLYDKANNKGYEERLAMYRKREPYRSQFPMTF